MLTILRAFSRGGDLAARQVKWTKVIHQDTAIAIGKEGFLIRVDFFQWNLGRKGFKISDSSPLSTHTS